MVRSMTGFGRAEMTKNDVKVSIEISSVNNRFCEIQLRLPKFLSSLEPQLKELLSNHITRGKISYALSWEENLPSSSYVKLNEEVADVYATIFKKLKKRYKLSGQIKVENFLNFPDLIKVEKEEYDKALAWEIISEVTLQAMDEFNRMRQMEGKGLVNDMKKRIENINQTLNEVENLAHLNVESYRNKLKSKISALLQDTKVDEDRLALEVALMAERSDITEECVRFKSHNEQFTSSLGDGGPIGRKLTFLLQEMNREANTIASKACDASISQKVILLKEEIEKLREQVQNIE
jgi:uncharacterized protein (TIGR00255 family)